MQQIILALSLIPNLSDSEKRTIATIIHKFITGTQQEKIKLNESLGIATEALSSTRGTTMNFAPVPGVCPRCGK